MRSLLGSRRGRLSLVLLALIAVGIVSYVVVSRVSAADEIAELVVNSAGDDYVSEDTRVCSSGSENCTLRAAIAEANGDDRANRISFDLPNDEDTIILTQYDTLEIENDVEDRDLMIEGTGDLTINGNLSSPVFTISGEDIFFTGTSDEETEVVISGLRITSGGSLIGAGVTNKYALLTLRDVIIHDNHAEGAGGGLHNYMGSVNVEDSDISSNSAPNTGGGIVNQGGEITLRNTSVNDNKSGLYGGSGIYNDPSGVLYFYGGELKDNETTSDETSGGGLFNSGRASFYGVEVSGNRSSYSGGGIFNKGGSVNLTRSSISDNSSRLGGGISTSGGLISDETTIAGNSAERGSGIYSDTSLAESDEVLIRKSTVYGNDGSTGVFNAQGRTTFVSSTVAGNQGGVTATADQFTRTVFERSIVTGNEGSDIELVFGDERDSIVSRGNNLAGSGSGTDALDAETDRTSLSAAEAFGREPVLEENGGPTRTVAISSDSPAIDAVSGEENCELPPLNTTSDQRSAEYVESDGGDGLCDIGAYEFGSKPADLSVSLTGPKNASPTDDLNYTATVRNAPNAGIATEVSLVIELDPPSTLSDGFSEAESCGGPICTVREFFSDDEERVKVDFLAPYVEGCNDAVDISCPVGDLDPGEERKLEVTLEPVEDSPEGSFSVRARASTFNDSDYPASQSLRTNVGERD